MAITPPSPVNIRQKLDSGDFEEVSCGICQEPFDEGTRCPRMLSCGHSFCHSCRDELLKKASGCPICLTGIQVSSELIPMPDIIPKKSNTAVELCYIKRGERVKPEKDSEKYLSEGYCKKHSNFRELRCMDCEVWICGLCGMFDHRPCRAILVREAYKEIKEQISKRMEEEVEERKTVNDRWTDSIKALNEERKSLAEELKRKEQEIKACKTRIQEFEALKFSEKKFEKKLKQLKTLVENSADDCDLSKTIKEMDKLKEQRQNLEPEDLLHLPLTLEVLASWIVNGPVYAIEDRYDGPKYGKLRVADGQIWINNFELARPEAVLIPFKELVSRFGDSKELPQKAFLRLTPEEGRGDDIRVVIKADGVSSRSKNFILLCSTLKGSSFIGLALDASSSYFYGLIDGPTPVFGVRDDDPDSLAKAGGVYGMRQHSSWFWLQLKKNPVFSSHKLGEIVIGLRALQKHRGKLVIVETGLVI